MVLAKAGMGVMMTKWQSLSSLSNVHSTESPPVLLVSHVSFTCTVEDSTVSCVEFTSSREFCPVKRHVRASGFESKRYRKYPQSNTIPFEREREGYRALSPVSPVGLGGEPRPEPVFINRKRPKSCIDVQHCTGEKEVEWPAFAGLLPPPPLHRITGVPRADMHRTWSRTAGLVA